MAAHRRSKTGDGIRRRPSVLAQPQNLVPEIESTAAAARRDVETRDRGIDPFSDLVIGDVGDHVVVRDSTLRQLIDRIVRHPQRRGLVYRLSDPRAIPHQHMPVAEQHRRLIAKQSGRASERTLLHHTRCARLVRTNDVVADENSTLEWSDSPRVGVEAEAADNIHVGWNAVDVTGDPFRGRKCRIGLLLADVNADAQLMTRNPVAHLQADRYMVHTRYRPQAFFRARVQHRANLRVRCHQLVVCRHLAKSEGKTRARIGAAVIPTGSTFSTWTTAEIGHTRLSPRAVKAQSNPASLPLSSRRAAPESPSAENGRPGLDERTRICPGASVPPYLTARAR